MKILFVIESLGNGGAERVLITNISALLQRGVRCEVVTLFKDQDLLNELRDIGVTVYQLNIGFRWNFFKIFSELKILIANGKYDVIDTHLFFAHFYIGFLKKMIWPQLKTVVTLHNMGYQANPATTVIKKFRKSLDKFALNTFDVKLAVSNSVAIHFKEVLDLQDIKVLHNGFVGTDLNFLQTPKPPLFLSNKVNILTPGRLVKEKGHEYLLKAIAEINKSVDNLNFFFAGDGPLRESLAKLIEKYEIENVILLGNLPQRELFKYIFYADLVVIPSISEGFGMVIGEAMLLNKAILATNVGGIPDFIDNGINGIMVNPKNHDELQEKIEQLVSNDELRKQLASAAIHKVQKFSIDKIIEKRIEIYKKLIN